MGTEGLDPVTSRNGEWLTVSQAAGLLGITAHTLREWSAAGAVEVHRTAGRHRRYRRADIERFRDALADGAGNEAVDERVREFSVLADVAQTVFAHIEPEETLKAICDKLMAAMGGTAVVVCTYDERSGTLTTLAGHRLEPRTYPVDGAYALSDYPATARVVKKQVVVQARFSDPRVDPAEAALMKEYGIKTLLVLPLVRGERTIGIAEVGDHRSERVFSRAEVKLARAIADQAALALYNALVYERLEARSGELKLLLDSASAIASGSTLDETLTTIAERLTRAMDVAWCDIYDYDPAKREAEIVAFYHIEGLQPAKDWKGVRYPVDDWTDLRRTVDERMPTITTISDPTLSDENRADMEEWGDQSSLTVPLVHNNRIVGLMDVTESRWERVFTEDDARIAMAIATQAAAAVHNMRLLEESRQRNRELEALLRIAQAVTTAHDLQSVLREVARTLLETLGAYWCEIYDYDAAAETLQVVVNEGVEPGDFGDWTGFYRLDDIAAMGQAVREKRTVITYATDPGLPETTKADMSRRGETSSFYTPMLYRGEVVGLAYLGETRDARHYAESEVRLAETMAAQAAAAIETARANAREQAEREQLAKVNRRLNALVEFSAQLRGLVEVDDLICLLDRVANEALGFRLWAVYLYDADTQSFRASTGAGIGSGAGAPYVRPLVPARILQGLTADATRISSSFFVDHRRHAWTDEENAYFPPYDIVGVREAEWHSEDTLLVPLATDKGEVLGYFEVYDPVDGRLPTEETVRQIEIFAGKAASTIELGRLHEQLELQARTDGLTGLFNHRYLAERLEEEVAKAQRYGAPLSVLMIDIDDFKPFNDTYGHPQGDKLLKEVARILLRGVRRKVDLVSRYGGEEFVVVLPNTPTGGAERLAERLRGSVAGDGRDAGGGEGTGETVGDGGRGGQGTGEAVGADGRAGVRTGEAVAEAIRLAMAEQRFEGYPERPDVQVTVSIGVACYPDDGSTAEELIANSDKALYVAKRSGKNRTHVYGRRLDT